jgi:hypothetical protein
MLRSDSSKRRHKQPVHPQVAERLEALTKTLQSCRRLRWRQEFPRQRLKGHHRSWQAKLLTLLGQLLDNRAMPKMYTIKGTNRGHTGAMSGTQPAETAKEIHDVVGF